MEVGWGNEDGEEEDWAEVPSNAHLTPMQCPSDAHLTPRASGLRKGRHMSREEKRRVPRRMDHGQRI